MPIDLYNLDISPYCRSVRLTAKAVGVNLNLKNLDLFAKENLKPEFIAINPQHTVPTLIDGDVKLWESRAICTYLASQYGKDDSLYPKDPKERAKVDAILYFDAGTLVPRWNHVFHPVKNGELDRPTQASVDKLHEAFGWLDGYIGSHKYVAGTNHITVADHVVISNISSYEAAGFLIVDYPNIYAWCLRCKLSMDGYDEINGENAKKFGEFVKSKIK